MPVRRCTVSFTDVRGCRHSTEVHAASVLEAAALGVRAIRDTGVLDDDSLFDITVELVTATRHVVPWPKVQAWLSSNSPDPATQARKANLKV